ncbi:MAG TPA: GNAT family N-acetyltransferase [Segetibacter sp.]|jgi:ribosomal protein S18 acetylase RimI-like enzyme
MYVFSKATTNDIPALNLLVNSAYRGETAKQGWTHESDLLTGIRIDERELTTLLTNKNTSIIKCTKQNEILACMLLEQQDDALYLGMLTVSPKLQGKGIGKMLLNEAEKEALSIGISKIKMTVISTRHELIDWYKRRGYKDSGIRKPFPKESEKFGLPLMPLEFIVMEKSI